MKYIWPIFLALIALFNYQSRVLAQETCFPLLTQDIKIGQADTEEVKKLQDFFNRYENITTLPITGIFGYQTIEAVNNFQSKYRAEILGDQQPTSAVGPKTRAKINSLYCANSVEIQKKEFLLKESIWDNKARIAQERKKKIAEMVDRKYLSNLGVHELVGIGPKDEILTEQCTFEKNLTLGSSGDEVKKLQTFLQVQKYLAADVKISGYFGPSTQTAVKNFQKKYADAILVPNKLKYPTGTWYQTTRLVAENVCTGNVPKEPVKVEPVKPKTILEAKKCEFSKDFAYGNSGEEIKNIQEFLQALGLLSKDIKIDGKYNVETVSAVRDFQEKYSEKILKPSNLKKGTGNWAKTTRGVAKDLCLGK